MRFWELRAPLLLGAVLLWFGSAASAVTVGVPAGTGNCFPYGCVGSFPSSRYQQVYTSAAFSGPLLIQEINFFQSLFPGGDLNGGTFTITLSTSLNPVNSLDTDFSSNIGGDAQLFAVTDLPSAQTIGGLSFNPTGGGAAFLYDPSMGDLLIDIQIAGIQNFGVPAFFDSREADAGGLFSTVHNFGPSGPAAFADSGLVTQFVPEPGTGLLLGLGLIALSRVRRPRH